MADINTTKLQLRSGLSINGDKTPSPATKLLINHGKPNFTIQRSPKIQNGNANPMSPPVSNEFVVKSTTFNGVFKPSNMSVATKQSLQQNGNGNSENEASKVVLRRAKVVETEIREGEDENVPEFIRRQRRIQERLANQNILDFESRRSGYFTHVMISPTNPNRQSFVETMASPAVMPSLEIPPPSPSPVQQEKVEEEVVEEQQPMAKSEEIVVAAPVTLNRQDEEEEEVAKAIEEVNKAVAGEDDDKTEVEETEQTLKSTVVAVSTLEHVEETKPEEKQEEEKPVDETPVVAAVVTSALVQETPVKENPIVAAVVTSALVEETPVKEAPIVAAAVTSALVVEDEKPPQNGHVEAVVTSAAHIDEQVKEPKTNGDVEVALQNGHSNGHSSDSEITISHTNGLNGPSIPSPDPSGEKGVNFEPKTVVSFSQELGSDVNKYPDTVKVVKDGQTPEVDDKLKELTKLKFEIKTDEQDIEVKPVIVTETA